MSKKLAIFDETIIIFIFSFLNANDLLNQYSVNKVWYDWSRDNYLWQNLLFQLWADKVYIPKFCKFLASSHPRIAYYLSILDSKRTFLTLDDLTSDEWSFRFKESAGEEWLQFCPWHQGLPASKVKFHLDGRVEREANEHIVGLVENLHITWSFKWITKSLRKTRQRNKALIVHLNTHESYELIKNDNDIKIDHHEVKQSRMNLSREGVTDPSPLIPFLWQPFKFQCLSPESVFDFPYSSSCLSSETSSQFHPIRMTANEDDSSNNMFQFQHFTEEEIRTKFLSGNYDDKYGDAVQLEVNQVAVPTYHVSRSPTGNWGFMLESCWAVYTSWEMPRKNECPELEDDALEVWLYYTDLMTIVLLIVIVHLIVMMMIYSD